MLKPLNQANIKGFIKTRVLVTLYYGKENKKKEMPNSRRQWQLLQPCWVSKQVVQNN